STAKFAVAPATETGPGTLYVIANGVASTGVEVTVGTGFPLSLSESGSGTVTSAPAGIDCPGTCDANFAARTRVTLTAAPAAGWRFSGWGGACAGIGACKVTVNAAKSVAATFTQFFGLTVSKSGRGRVTSRPAGIACGKNCSADFAAATTVALRASAAAGWHFAGWGGACSGTARCRVSLEAAAGVTALFEK
ncbi:MAG TPA: hypothetical protein VGR91_16370, partial [Stellaceae bacterium]|nr:hypothetical protein [Stellaceae bacterium]